MTVSSFTQGLLDFLSSSPTPFHAVGNMTALLKAEGFSALDEAESWQLEPGQRYYLTRNDSSIIAFIVGTDNPAESGLRLFGAHTDSPCLKVKPQPVINKSGCVQLGVETYGGVLLNPWFDRDLSLAGRVSFRRADGSLGSALIDLKRAIATIPSLAIHLDREANEGRTVNKQNHLPPIISLQTSQPMGDFREWLKQQLAADQGIDEVLDYELSFYDSQAPGLIGLQQELIASARLDNLLSCYVGLQSLIAADNQVTSILVCNDHEEVGSSSHIGAQGPMLQTTIQRLIPDAENRARTLARSAMISADNAHAVHPNYADKHDKNHGPLLNAGPVIKLNANQRYATNSETSALFRHVCQIAEVPFQEFVVRSDLACGSTIGPITSAEIGVPTVDVGVPQLGMHSIRELCGVDDAERLYKAAKCFFGLQSVSF
ncbi:MAG: M18 family aminopeptidase [Pseudomonadales bacterium]